MRHQNTKKVFFQGGQILGQRGRGRKAWLLAVPYQSELRPARGGGEDPLPPPPLAVRRQPGR